MSWWAMSGMTEQRTFDRYLVASNNLWGSSTVGVAPDVAVPVAQQCPSTIDKINFPVLDSHSIGSPLPTARFFPGRKKQ
ncbi:hypothetical protein A9K55_003095 [Cordyceps militaris]|uniref:Uncharacterized protein n=1 Tax=Cordyceps militaris TaxID=73501 RepID=A0A2H4S6V1_CORMI|nr:hypothetical protein A9K55_003095 [Cordyceps militaris]